MTQKHPIDRASDHLGGATKLAALLGVSAQAISNWKERGVPIERCVAIERATSSEVTRKDLRPDDWRAIWPELDAAGGPKTVSGLPPGVAHDRRDPARISPYAGTDIDRRAPAAGEGA